MGLEVGVSKPGIDMDFVCENTVLCTFDAFATVEVLSIHDFWYIDFGNIGRGSASLLGGPDSWNVRCSDVGHCGVSLNKTGTTTNLLFVFLSSH